MKSPSNSVSFIASAFFVPSSFDQWASLIRAAAAAGGTMKAGQLRTQGLGTGTAALLRRAWYGVSAWGRADAIMDRRGVPVE